MGQPATPTEREGVIPSSPNIKYATLHLKSNLGSFKLRNGEGRVEIAFTGTLLISQLAGTVDASPTLRQEYKDRGRIVYFGKGRVIVRGKFRGIQWFGRNMKVVWWGAGIAQLTGEYDKNLSTGWFWYDDPKKRSPWYAQGSYTITLPERGPDTDHVTPKERTNPPPGSGGG